MRGRELRPGDDERRPRGHQARGDGARRAAAGRPRAAGAARLQLPLVLAARWRRSCSSRSTPSGSRSPARTRSACSRRPRTPPCGARPPTKALLERAAAVEAQVKADLDRPYYPSIDPARPVAFLCAEYGVHVSLPIYSGGLGALAGDLLKEASDCAVPMVAVGLMYRKGYFRQRIDAGGWQHEYWVDTDPQRLPAALVTGADDRPLTIEVPIYDADVTAQIWRVDVGRIPLFLLDTDLPENGPVRAVDHRAAVRVRRAHPPGPVRAARRRRRARADRARDRARRDPPERGPRDARAVPARLPGAALGREAVGRPRVGARAHRVHDPHPGPRRQRHLPVRARCEDAIGRLVATVRLHAGGPDRARPHASRGRERRSGSRRPHCG